jgi:hypothetical protein
LATTEAKANGSYYTPTNVARTLVRWAVRRPEDRLLDPSCGDGQFLSLHRESVGVEQDQRAAIAASHRAPGCVVHVEDFFAYAATTNQRFECAAGNPPFIRYQRFSGDVRRRALHFCHRLGAPLSGLTSSWAPFLVAAASLLKPGGRMAFVVPAEIGHAPYAAPLVKFLSKSFGKVHLVAVRETVFPDLSQDVWLLYAADYGSSTDSLSLTAWDEFRSTARPPTRRVEVSVHEWIDWACRLRPFLIPEEARHLYRRLSGHPDAFRLGDVARVGIGYVTGANDFFHLRPSTARFARISDKVLIPTVRSGRVLPPDAVGETTVAQWVRQDEPCLLLRLRADDVVPDAVRRYLDSDTGREARKSYKCRNRKPWYVVPDVVVPHGFLTYMSGNGPALVANEAGCTCTNSLHAVRMQRGHRFSEIKAVWDHPLTRLSAELEGHPLGGGMLKLEPREAIRVLAPRPGLRLARGELERLEEARGVLRQWRHYA